MGAGGGFVLGPVFLLFFELEHGVVAGTALALVAVNSVSGALAYRRMGLVDYRSGLLFAAAAIPGSVIAPFVVTAVAGGLFRILFGALLIVLAVQMLFRHRLAEDSPDRQRKHLISATVKSRVIRSGTGRTFRYEFNEALATGFNFVLGFISSFFGTGGGFLRTPILVSVFGFPVQVAAATSVFTLSFYTSTGAITHAALGHIDWFPTFLWAGIGLVAGGQIGARLAGVVTAKWILRLLLVVVLGLGIGLVIEGVGGA